MKETKFSKKYFQGSCVFIIFFILLNVSLAGCGFFSSKKENSVPRNSNFQCLQVDLSATELTLSLIVSVLECLDAGVGERRYSNTLAFIKENQVDIDSILKWLNIYFRSNESCSSSNESECVNGKRMYELQQMVEILLKKGELDPLIVSFGSFLEANKEMFLAFLRFLSKIVQDPGVFQTFKIIGKELNASFFEGSLKFVYSFSKSKIFSFLQKSNLQSKEASDHFFKFLDSSIEHSDKIVSLKEPALEEPDFTPFSNALDAFFTPEDAPEVFKQKVLNFSIAANTLLHGKAKDSSGQEKFILETLISLFFNLNTKIECPKAEGISFNPILSFLELANGILRKPVLGTFSNTSSGDPIIDFVLKDSFLRIAEFTSLCPGLNEPQLIDFYNYIKINAKNGGLFELVRFISVFYEQKKKSINDTEQLLVEWILEKINQQDKDLYQGIINDALSFFRSIDTPDSPQFLADLIFTVMLPDLESRKKIERLFYFFLKERSFTGLSNDGSSTNNILKVFLKSISNGDNKENFEKFIKTFFNSIHHFDSMLNPFLEAMMKVFYVPNVHPLLSWLVEFLQYSNNKVFYESLSRLFFKDQFEGVLDEWTALMYPKKQSDQSVLAEIFQETSHLFERYVSRWSHFIDDGADLFRLNSFLTHDFSSEGTDFQKLKRNNLIELEKRLKNLDSCMELDLNDFLNNYRNSGKITNNTQSYLKYLNCKGWDLKDLETAGFLMGDGSGLIKPTFLNFYFSSIENFLPSFLREFESSKNEKFQDVITLLEGESGKTILSKLFTLGRAFFDIKDKYTEDEKKQLKVSMNESRVAVQNSLSHILFKILSLFFKELEKSKNPKTIKNLEIFFGKCFDSLAKYLELEESEFPLNQGLFEKIDQKEIEKFLASVSVLFEGELFSYQLAENLLEYLRFLQNSKSKEEYSVIDLKNWLESGGVGFFSDIQWLINIANFEIDMDAIFQEIVSLLGMRYAFTIADVSLKAKKTVQSINKNCIPDLFKRSKYGVGLNAYEYLKSNLFVDKRNLALFSLEKIIEAFDSKDLEVIEKLTFGTEALCSLFGNNEDSPEFRKSVYHDGRDSVIALMKMLRKPLDQTKLGVSSKLSEMCSELRNVKEIFNKNNQTNFKLSSGTCVSNFNVIGHLLNNVFFRKIKDRNVSISQRSWEKSKDDSPIKHPFHFILNAAELNLVDKVGEYAKSFLENKSFLDIVEQPIKAIIDFDKKNSSGILKVSVPFLVRFVNLFLEFKDLESFMTSAKKNTFFHYCNDLENYSFKNNNEQKVEEKIDQLFLKFYNGIISKKDEIGVALRAFIAIKESSEAADFKKIGIKTIKALSSLLVSNKISPAFISYTTKEYVMNFMPYSLVGTFIFLDSKEYEAETIDFFTKMLGSLLGEKKTSP